MNAQGYIQSKLGGLREPLGIVVPANTEQLMDTIYKAITSKKFRRYSLGAEHAKHIESAIRLNVAQRQPIQLTLVFGGYKLWRLEESPEVDWAELFSLIYYTNWMTPICEFYEPGVWFDFFSDDVIVPKMNNISPDDTRAYVASFRELLDFIKPFQPKNLNMTLNRVGDQYENSEAFEKDLEEQMKIVAASHENSFPNLDDTMKATLDLNVRLTDEQRADSQWQSKVQLMHDGYAQVKGRRPYYRVPDKMSVMTTPFNGMLSVGTTKDSIMKFWVGAGVLKKRDGEYRQLIFSPNQLANNEFSFEDVGISGLEGKTFKKVRVVS